MRVTIVSSVMAPQRVPEADYAWHLASKLLKLGHHVEVITTRGMPAQGPAGARIRATVTSWSWRGLLPVLVAIARSRPHLVITSYIGWMYGNHPMITTLPRTLSRLFPRKRVVTVVQNVDHNDLNVMAHPRTRRVLKALRLSDIEPRFGTLISDSSHVIVGSHAQRDVLIGTWPAANDRVTVAPPPSMDLVRDDRQAARAEGRTRLGLDSNDEVIGFFGYRYPGKGVETLVEAFASLAPSRPRLKLAFIGGLLALPAEGGVTTGVRRRLEELQLSGRVAWSGEFETGSMEASTFLHALDVVALPFDIGIQLSHSTASTVLSHGLPLVTTTGGATDDAWSEMGGCLLVPPKDPAALAEALEAVLQDADLRASLRAGTQRMVSRWMSWPSYLDRFV